MRGYGKMAFCLLFILGVWAVTAPAAFSLEGENESGTEVATSEITGEVVSVDVEQSNLVVKQLTDEVNQIYQDVTIAVDDSTTITKGEETITLAALTAGEMATVVYIASSEGVNTAVSIQVEAQ